jgi:23S rRNA (guanine745-N1)-methyltransferase
MRAGIVGAVVHEAFRTERRSMNGSAKYTIYKCPVCENMLTAGTGQYICKNNHSFDIAKEGYVNLLYPAKRNTEQGDSKEMVLARRGFLQKGHYRALSDGLAGAVKDISSGKPVTLVDSACGEGYYLKYIIDSPAVPDNVGISAYGFDISKSAIKLAAKNNKNIAFAVANVFKLPVLDKSVDAVLSVFSPFNEDEIFRVTKDRGRWIIVRPGAHHLFELKSKLYDRVELNDGAFQLSRFKVLEKIDLRYNIDIRDSETIRDLITMTPYYWKTGRGRIESVIKGMAAMQSRIEFDITICHKP